ncbi:MAG: two-component system invasion response regulator UvrY [Lysobacterales bacterium]
MILSRLPRGKSISGSFHRTKGEITSITEASTGEHAVKMCHKLEPDVIILDIRLPGLSAFESTRRLKRVRPQAGIIILAVHAKSPYPTRLLEAGASGYLTRDCSSDELLEAVKTVARGGRFIGAEAAKQLALSILPGNAESPFDELSARELEVMLKLTEGNLARQRLPLNSGQVAIRMHKCHYSKVRRCWVERGSNGAVSLARCAVTGNAIRLKNLLPLND